MYPGSMYRVLPASLALMLAAGAATAQQSPRDAFDDWREPAPRYIERYRPPHEPDAPPRAPAAQAPYPDRRDGPPGGWQVSPRDWRDAERMYGFRGQRGWPPAPREGDRQEPRDGYANRDHGGRDYGNRDYGRDGDPRRDGYRAPPPPADQNPYAPRPAHLDRAQPPAAPPTEPRRANPEAGRPAAPLYDPGEDFEQPRGQAVMSGGARPAIQPVRPERVAYAGKWAPGTVIIETQGRQLLLVVARGEALRYPISVGRIGFQWTGTERISRIADWPDWHPPASMRQREPYLPLKMTGGIRNPLGAKALYLGNSLYRIHGTNDARTIGLASSSGCFRMLNGHVVDLASRVRAGTAVVVLNRLPRGVLQ